MNIIVLNIHPFEKRLAILEDSRLSELIVERKDHANIVHNIYKGIVKDVLPGMGAAFINIGLERTAFLHYSDIVTDFFEDVEDDSINDTINLSSTSNSSNIKNVLKEGQEIIVQVKKGPINKKGARLTCQISIPGKYLVLFPNKDRIAISRKINSQQEKNRIRSVLNSIKDKNTGLIVRTDAEGNTEEDFKNEYKGLFRTWQLIEHKIKAETAPNCIYDENDLANKLIRDFFHSDIDKLIVDNKGYYKELVSEMKDIAPELVKRIELYREDSPIFDAFGIEKEIEKMYQAKIPLPSGGNITIEQTEALVAIDVNTGSFIGHNSYEATVKKTNIEAAIEVSRQIKLRDLSGIMVIDFIDMESESSKNEVFEILRQNLRKDRAKNKVYYFGPLGLVEVTRNRMRPGIYHTTSQPCSYCKGSGRVLSQNAVAMNIFRSLQRAEYFVNGKNVKLIINPSLNTFLHNNPGYFNNLKLNVTVVEESSLRDEQFKILYDNDKKELRNTYSA